MDKGSIFHLSVEREDRMSMGPSLNTAAEGIIMPRCEEKGKGNRKRTTSSSALKAVLLFGQTVDLSVPRSLLNGGS